MAAAAVLAWLLLGPLAGVAFLAYIATVTGAATAFLDAQQAWGREGIGGAAPDGTIAAMFTPYQGALILTLLASCFLLIFRRVDRLRLEYFLVPVLFIAAELSSGSLEAVGRITMLAFPLVWILANRRSDLCPPRLADAVGRAVRDHRRPAVRGVLGPVSLTLVLPAFNEAERIGPALDELFGYLRRRDDHARDGALGAAALPDEIEVLVVDDGSTDETVGLVEARPEAAGSIAGVTLRVQRVPHGGKGAAVRAGMLAATGDLVIFTDADMATPPDQIPLLVAALADHDVALGSRIQPDGSDMRATQPGYRRLLGKAVPPARVGLGRRAASRTPSAGSRGSVARRPRTSSRGSGSRASSSTSSSSTSPAGAATRMAIVPDPLVRQAWLAHARSARAWRCGSPGTCSGSRSSTEGVSRSATERV